MRKLASIATIATAEPIPEADRLDVVTLEGKAWRIVTARNEFRPGDRAVYFEIDSALPADDERYAFLRERCLRTWSDKHGNALKQAVRIRTVRLNGVISQGLVMPLSTFPELADKAVGDDVTSDLRVEHFDEISEQMRAALDTRCPQGFGRREGNFPAWIPKTDEERIQNLADWPERLKGILVRGRLVGVSKLDIKAGTLGALATTGVYDVAKGETAFAAGDKVYWNAAENKAAAESGVLLGLCVQDADSAASTVRVILRGGCGGAAARAETQARRNQRPPPPSPT